MELGVGRMSVHYWSKKGRFVPVARGVYRLVGYYDEGPADRVWPAWLRIGPEAVVSHESALELHELADVIPAYVHLTVRRALRYRTTPADARLHTILEPLGGRDVAYVFGLPVTSVERTIVDCAASGTQPDQIELACHEAVVDRGLTTPERLRRAASRRSRNVERRIERALEIAHVA